ncbi:MAG: hypothetical protein J2P48_19385, partial [Alphaproteobacteria bacterium]|nr:hypothetical protein [Alphaproteobacteria bacterium]
MQLEIGDPIDYQTMPPLLGGAIGAGVEQPIQDRQKYRALEIELEAALAGQLADYPLAAGFPLHSFHRQRRTELARGQFGRLAFLIGGEHTTALLEKRAPERNSRSSVPSCASSSTRPRVATTNWRGLPAIRSFLTICR